MDAITLSEQATLERFNAQQDRVARDMGYGDTVGALKITKDALEPLSAYIQTQIENLSRDPQKRSEEQQFLQAIAPLAPETIALATLNGALHSIALGEPWAAQCSHIGAVIHGECWAAGLTAKDPELAGKVSRLVRRRHGSLKYRQQAARSIAKRAGYKAERWPTKVLLAAGAILLQYLLQALPETFVCEEETGPEGGIRKWLTITPGALANAERAVEQALRGSPVFLPATEQPAAWTGYWDGGYWNAQSRFKASVIRTRYKETAGAVGAAIKDGTMAPFLSALNHLQAVPWRINKRMLGIINWAIANDVHIKGLPPMTDLPMPEKGEWDAMSEAGRKLWKQRASKVKQRNRTFMSQRIMSKMDRETAEILQDAERFWTPMNADWRGRVYAVTSFNFQRDDRVRALFLFADGEPIGEEGLYWLKVHVANTGDFDKVSKRPLAERVKWTEDNLKRIEQMTCVPTKELWWTKADKPFLFLSACMELMAALSTASPTKYLTRLPVSFDGSCSGLQHLSAMTRDEQTARLVNLLPSREPQDVYLTVASAVERQVNADAADGVLIAEAWKRHGITRKLVKRNVMTYSYSSKKFGMAQQLMDDVMRPLEFQVLAGELPEHPFGEDNGKEAAKYLASITFDTIEAIVHRPAQAMHMLQKVARVMAHEGKPVTWTTPLGLPWINRYHDMNMKRLDLWLHDIHLQVRYADGHKADVDKDRAANGVAPNFVHACDATHLLMVANACACENITQLATVHDSFGCLASQAGRFRQIIREQFVELYEKNDVLTQVLAQAQHDLTVHNTQRLPTGPAFGNLNLKEVLNAEYAFA